VELTRELSLVQLPADQVEAYTRACDPAHFDFPYALNDSQRYSFVRTPAPTEHGGFRWDQDELIQTAIQLSRYVVLNAHCTEVAARRIEGLPPGRVQIAALDTHARFYAFKVPTDARDWLDQDDAEALGGLLRLFLDSRERLPTRITRAMWLCEWSFGARYTEIAIGHVVTALEALLKTGKYGSTLQFRRRVPALARALGIPGVTARRAQRFYNARSRAVHGLRVPVTVLTPATQELDAMQRLLMMALRRAIEDQEFRSSFKSGPAVSRRWPL
jgi:hypothetical protein